MNFTERNAAWRGEKRQFAQVLTRASAPRVWTIEVVGANIRTTWGQQGGAMQNAEETMVGVNLGKKNEMSPEAYALDRAQEFARKKNWEGYREVGDTGAFLDEAVVTDIDFNALSESLSFYKPLNTMSAGLTKKAEAGKVVYAEKRNGLMFVLCRGDGEPQLYSRRMLRQHDLETDTDYTWDNRFPHIIAAASKIMPMGSILLGELVVDLYDEGHPGRCDDFKAIQRLSKSLTPAAIELQKEEITPPKFVVWDVAFWSGADLVKTLTFGQRREILEKALCGVPEGLCLVDCVHFSSPEMAIESAKAAGLEGYIVIDPEALYGDKAYNFAGKPQRPAACAKLKPLFESDFIAIWDPDNKNDWHPELKNRGERSTKGSSGQGVKSVALYQLDTGGKPVFVSNVGVGLTDEMRTLWVNPRMWPQVWEVAYTERTFVSDGDDTNALTFARFVRTRDDKSIDECIEPRMDS